MRFRCSIVKTNRVVKLEILDPGGDDLTGLSADAFVTLLDGAKYATTLFTIDGVRRIMAWGKLTGECRSGTYFYCQHSIILRELTDACFRSTVESLLESGGFDDVFVKQI